MKYIITVTQTKIQKILIKETGLQLILKKRFFRNFRIIVTLWVCECDVALSDVQGYCAAVLCEQDKSNVNMITTLVAVH